MFENFKYYSFCLSKFGKFNILQSFQRLLSPLPVTNPACTRCTFTSVGFVCNIFLVSNETIAPQWVHLEESVSFKPCLLLLSCHCSNLLLLLLHELQTSELNKKICNNAESTSLLWRISAVAVWVICESQSLVVLLLVYGGQSETRRNVLEKSWWGECRRVWKTFFVTVAMIQVKLVKLFLLVNYLYSGLNLYVIWHLKGSQSSRGSLSNLSLGVGG